MGKSNIVSTRGNIVLAVLISTVTINRNHGIVWDNVEVESRYFGVLPNQNANEDNDKNRINDEAQANPFVTKENLNR